MESPSPNSFVPSSAEPYSIFDWWFEAIDHQQIGTGGSSWIAEVVGIHSDGEDLWVQVSSRESPGSTVVLRLGRNSSAEDVTTALADSCHWPVTALQVIDLRP
jgi:hypothetical protein